MDYFNIIILVIVTFVFVTDRKLKDLDTIDKAFPKIKSNISKITSDLEIINCNMENLLVDDIIRISETSNKNYIILKSKRVSLNKKEVKIIIGNYIVSNKSICGYKSLYTYDKKSEVSFLRKLYINGINYLNIFDRRNI